VSVLTIYTFLDPEATIHRILSASRRLRRVKVSAVPDKQPKLVASRKFRTGITQNPSATASSAAFSSGTITPAQLSARARNAIGSASLSKSPLLGACALTAMNSRFENNRLTPLIANVEDGLMAHRKIFLIPVTFPGSVTTISLNEWN
jgi:hypothetical protein